MEPVKGLLSRINRRKLTQVEVEAGVRQPKLQKILDWLPRCWMHINKFLETHSSSDVTIGEMIYLCFHIIKYNLKKITFIFLILYSQN